MNLESIIHQGLREGYELDVSFNLVEDEFSHSMIEYLLTVSIAKRIKNYFDDESINAYKIILEYSLIKFYLNCFPLKYEEFEDNNPFLIRSIYRVIDGLQKNQKRLDIALIGIDNNRTFYGIELKGINPKIKKKLDDLDRLAIGFENVSNMIDSSLENCFFCYIYNPSSKNKIYNNSHDSIKLIESVIEIDKNAFELNHPTLVIESTYEILKESTSDSFNKEFDFDEVTRLTGIIFSVLYKIVKKEI